MTEAVKPVNPCFRAFGILLLLVLGLIILSYVLYTLFFQSRRLRFHRLQLHPQALR